MALKLLKGLWFLSMFVALIVLLYIYAGLPQTVVVQEEDGVAVSLSNDGFFYILMALLVIANVLTFIMAKLFKEAKDFRAWFYGLIASINLFFIIGMNLISLYNSGERFEYERIEFVIYGSLALIVLWASVWPVFALFKKLNAKASI
ncbi:MAG TPA: hypothetical protein VJ184_15945 [Chryseolinea sp.]|nr:hypothetical protein [Chryseolinea sp.]